MPQTTFQTSDTNATRTWCINTHIYIYCMYDLHCWALGETFDRNLPHGLFNIHQQSFGGLTLMLGKG